MAGAESAVHRVLVEKPSIPERLINGSKFIKWPKSDNDDSIIAVQVTLRIDPQGHVIYWQEPGRDTECLEISCIRDTRAGKYAKEPKDSQLIKMVCNSSVPVTEKCLTIVYGVKLVELTFLNFVSVEPEPHQCVKEWADFLLLLAYHPCTRHVSVQTSVEKAYTRLKLETNQMGEIPVKKLIKVLGGKSRRVDHALLSVGLVTGKRDVSIKPEDFHLTGFKKLLQFCCLRPELDTVFSSLGTGARRMYVSQQKFKEFINTEQRDPKLNEILYPVKTDDQVLEYITNFESNEMFAAKGQLTLEGLDAYLQSDDNLIVEPDRYAEHQSMTAPLSHYFINSSHNTYLTGTQLRSKSSAEIYRQVLLTGCRCVELDCWEGDEEPVINHGFTLCTHVLFREVIEAINESAFKTSPYPVILSFENHVDNPQQQAKMAQYCRDIFGDKLLIDPLSKYPIVSDSSLPPPSEIKYKIIVKNKKQRPSADSMPKSPTEESFRERGKRPSNASETFPLSPIPESKSTRRSLHNRETSTSSLNSDKSSRPSARTESSSRSQRPSVDKPLVEEATPPATEATAPKSEATAPATEATTPAADTTTAATEATATATDATVSTTDTTAAAATTPATEATPPATEATPSSTDATPPTTKSTPPTTDAKRNGSESSQDDKPTSTSSLESVGSKDRGSGTNSESENASTAAGDKESKSSKSSLSQENGEENSEEKSDENGKSEKSNSKGDEDEDSDDEEGRITNLDYEENAKEAGTAMKESKAYEAMSSLVNYVQPVRFKSFDISERRKRCYEISSFTESAALRLLTFYPMDFVRYNRRQMSRIYPKGARVDSSNYMPQIFWNAGCQFVALNFQILDQPMQLNMGLFEFNGSTGYILKPPHMRIKDRQFDPFSKNLDGVVAITLKIKIISGQFLSSSKVSTYVEVDMYGLPADTIRKRFKTKTVEGNSLNPYYNGDEFVFEKVVLPNLATLRIAVMETNGSMLGQRFLPVDALKPGYRYITLRNEGNQPLTMPSIFIHLQVGDYVPPELMEFSEALVNPITYMKEKERAEKELKNREKALNVLLGNDANEVYQVHLSDQIIVDARDNAKKSLDRENRAADSPARTNPSDSTNTSVTKTTSAPSKQEKSEMTLEPFEAQTLNDLRLSKAYQKIMKENDKALNKLKKKHKETFTQCYNQLFAAPRRSTFLGVFFSKRRTSTVDVSIDMNPAMPDETKKRELMKLLQVQFEAERVFRIEQMDSFIMKLETVVKDHQRVEMDKLAELSAKEQAALQRQKDMEKEQNIRAIPPNLGKDEVDRKKKEINSSHIDECVRIRGSFLLKQEEREKEVRKEQEEILNSVEDERKNVLEKIDADYHENLSNVAEIYEIRKSDMNNRKGAPSAYNDVPDGKPTLLEQVSN